MMVVMIFVNFYEKVQNAAITFTMYDVETNVKKIANSKASIQLKDPNCSIGGENLNTILSINSHLLIPKKLVVIRDNSLLLF